LSERTVPDYKVNLDIYSGPLDLLLYLIEESEVDICDIPIAKIVEQYLSYLEVLKSLDLNVAGDFLVMASTLMEIKSRMLLPQSELPPEEAEEDPRLELVRQLIEYKRFKEAARDLAYQAAERAKRFSRVGEIWEQDAKARPLDKEVSLWDLIKAFGEILRQTTISTTARVVYDDTPIEVHMEEILHRLRTVTSLSFFEFFRDGQDKARIIGIFLALLELIKQRKLKATQSAAFSDIAVSLRTEEPEPAAEPEPPPEQAEPPAAPPTPQPPPISFARKDEEEDDLDKELEDLDLDESEDEEKKES
jgi:segregation and condensation protein A